MSYDLNLFRKDNFPEPFEEKVLQEKLAGVYGHLSVYLHEGRVTNFEVRTEEEKDSIEFSYQIEDGCYKTYCSYSVDDTTFRDFKRTVSSVAHALNLLIEDPQLGEERMEPEAFDKTYDKSTQTFEATKQITGSVMDQLPYLIPATATYFTVYFITSEDPVTKSRMVLTFESGQLYASKVEAGTSLHDTVKKDLKELLGASTFTIVQVSDYDTAHDKDGNELPRSAVLLTVPYVDPALEPRKHTMEWQMVD